MTNKELDMYAIEYQDTTDEKRRNRLFKKIYKKYYPYISKRISDMQDSDKDDVLQIYSVQILVALEGWERRASFGTYLYSHIRGSIKEWVRTHKNKMFKDGRYHQLIGNMDDYTSDTLYDFCSIDDWDYVK